MNIRLSIMLVAAVMAALFLPPSSQALTLLQLLERFDEDGDLQLNAREFAKAQAAVGLPTKTARGAERAARWNKAVNKAVKDYPNLELRYAKRALAAALIRTKFEQENDDSRTASDQLAGAGFSTHERFILERAGRDPEGANPSGAAVAPSPTPGPIIRFVENNFRIRDDMEGVTGEAADDGPAKFSYTHPKAQSSYYSIDAAILFTPSWLDWNWEKMETNKIPGQELRDIRGWVTAARVWPAFEAHVSTKEGSTRNQLKYAALIQGRSKYFPGGNDNFRTETRGVEKSLPFVSAFNFEISPTYVTDRVAAVKSWGLDAVFEPSVPFFNLNYDGARPLFGLRWLEGEAKGRFGVSLRSYEQGNPVPGADDNYGVFIAGLKGKLVFFQRLTVSASYATASDLWGDMKSHDLFEGSAELLVDERNHFSVGMSYIHGEEEPTFERVDTVTGWVGVRF